MKKHRELDEKTIKKFEKRIRYATARYGRPDLGNEASQEILCRMLEGRHQHSTIDQAVIDYLRERCGSKKLLSHIERKNFEYANSYEQGSFDKFVSTSMGGDLDARLDLGRVFSHLRAQDVAVMNLWIRMGYSEVEIGDIFGVSESRVSQWISRIQKCLSTRAKAEESRIRSREMAAVLPQKAEGNQRGLEQGPYQGMAFIESWPLAGFDETSF
jgi:DNA-directed RNA polymerase specialized sigma24 family protein